MRAYRVLLHVYPSSFRAEYGEEMAGVFAQRRRDASNVFLAMALWVETFFDVITSAIKVHLDILAQDLRYGAHTLGRAPGFTITAVLVAALGIGATTAAFTMIDHVLIRPLPFADQDRLVRLYESHPAVHIVDFDASPANYRDWQQMSASFEDMGAYQEFSMNLVGRQGNPHRVSGAAVTGEIFSMLGVKPELGRFFSGDDDRETSPGTVVLSDGLWQREFGGDASVLGRKVILDDTAYTVIGVMPKTFYFPTRDATLWTTFHFHLATASAPGRDRRRTRTPGAPDADRA